MQQTVFSVLMPRDTLLLFPSPYIQDNQTSQSGSFSPKAIVLLVPSRISRICRESLLFPRKANAVSPFPVRRSLANPRPPGDRQKPAGLTPSPGGDSTGTPGGGNGAIGRQS